MSSVIETKQDEDNEPETMVHEVIATSLPETTSSAAGGTAAQLACNLASQASIEECDQEDAQLAQSTDPVHLSPEVQPFAAGSDLADSSAQANPEPAYDLALLAGEGALARALAGDAEPYPELPETEEERDAFEAAFQQALQEFSVPSQTTRGAGAPGEADSDADATASADNWDSGGWEDVPSGDDDGGRDAGSNGPQQGTGDLMANGATGCKDDGDDVLTEDSISRDGEPILDASRQHLGAASGRAA